MPSPISHPISNDNIQCDLQERVTSLSYALLSTAEAVSRAVVGNLALLGYAVTLGHWQEAYTFGTEQLKKGCHAGSDCIHQLYDMIWPQQRVSQPSVIAAAPQIAKPECKEPPQPLVPVLPIPQPNPRAQLIAAKLQRQFDRAQAQAAAEHTKDFKYRVAQPGLFPSPWTDPGQKFDQEYDEARICGFETGFCHFSGRRDEMEDEHLSTAINFAIKGKIHTAAVFGVFDGHVGKEAAVFVKENLQIVLERTLEEVCADGLTQESIRDALKETFRRLDQGFTPKKSGTTATVAMLLNGRLWTANVGDSRIILDNGIQLTEDATPNDPNYKKRIIARGGCVLRQRVNGYLGVARAIGDHDVIGVCAEAKIIDFPISELPENSHLILTCDGIYEVASTRQIAKVVQDNKALSALDLAKNIVYSAYHSDSGDNLTALVVKLWTQIHPT